MGSIGSSTNSLPRYSNENQMKMGVIVNSVVQADPRYQAVSSVEGIKEYQAADLLRKVMKMEENGETTGSVLLYGFERDEKNGQTFGKFLTAYSRALKAAGYKVTSRENEDSHSRGYVGARGRRVYAHTTQARTLNFEKIEDKKKRR